ncbi:hypothetical protein BX070DRAFT_228502 [Coemansia spiralis]|nr:hypothetical protein BX070DRAFT_228502 [Coemansia spiralis]
MDFVSVPVFGRIHAGSEVEVKYLKEARINGIDELEFASTLSGATLHVNKLKYDNLPFICGATCLSQAIRRVEEGASMICIKGSAYDDTPNPAQAIEDIERIQAEIATVFGMAGDDDALRLHASRIGANYNYVKQVAQLGRLPVPLFAAGGITQPSDAAHMLEMGCDGVIISNFLFKTPNPAKRASAIISAIACPSNHGLLAAISEDLE